MMQLGARSSDDVINVQTVIHNLEISAMKRTLENLQALHSNPPMGFRLNIVIVSNNGYQMDRIRLELKKYPQFRLIELEENVGHGQAHNLAFNESDASKYLLVINPDGILSPPSLTQLLSVFSRSPKTGVVDAMQLPYAHPKRIDQKSLETSWASGACALFNSIAFKEVQGFDKEFFLHGDDVDISWRLAARGYQIKSQPLAKFFHDKRISRNGFPQVSDPEKYYGPLSALIIAHRYGMHRSLTSMLHELQMSDIPLHRDIIADFEKRKLSARKMYSPKAIDFGNWQFADAQ